MRVSAKAAICALSMIAMSACEVDPLEQSVSNPSHQAAFSAGSGVVSRGSALQTGQLVNIHLTDGGYKGSGPATDMNSFRAMRWGVCRASTCSPIAGAEETLVECERASGGRTSCADKDMDGTLLGRVSFYDDQRFTIQNSRSGRFISGVWHQGTGQKQRAERVYRSMMDGFQPALESNYTRVADARRAPLDLLEAVGEAGYAISGVQQPGSASQSSVTSASGEYNIGNHPIEVQSRQVASRYSCERAQSIPHVSGAACESFGALVIIEACRSIIPPADYNKDQSEFLRVVRDFSNQGEDFTTGICGF